MSLRIQDIHIPTNLVENLSKFQIKAAKSFEAVFLFLKDFPELGQEVRFAADDAQTQHILTLGLMERFKITADHVVNEIIPLINDGIELEVPEIAEDALKLAIDCAKNMEKETSETADSYLKVKEAVQKQISNFDGEKRSVTTMRKNIECQMKQQYASVRQKGNTYNELKESKIENERTMMRHRNIQTDLMAMSITSGDRGDLIVVAQLTMAASQCAGLPVSAAVAAVGLAASEIRRNWETRRLFKAVEIEEGIIDKLEILTERKSEEMRQLKEESLQAVADLKRMQIEKATLGDMRDLQNASEEIGEVSDSLVKLARYWNEFVSSFKDLTQRHDKPKILLKHIASERAAAQFRDNLDILKQSWEKFHDVCLTYVETNSAQMDGLYKFLTVPVDHFTDQESEGRQQQLLEEIDLLAIGM